MRWQIKHYKGRMVTLSGKELNSLAELIRHYKDHTDGLSARLTCGCTAYDPPRNTSARPPAPPVPRRPNTPPHVPARRPQQIAAGMFCISSYLILYSH